MSGYDEIREIGADFSARAKGGLGIYKGDCMYPFLKEGCRIRFEPVSGEEIRLGDVVVIGTKPHNCHRIINKFRYNGRTYLFHKGDNDREIKLVPENLIIGKVIGIADKGAASLSPDHWKGYKHTFLIKALSFSIFFIFRMLCFLKRMLMGRRKNMLTVSIRNFYWNLFHSAFKHIM